MRLESWSLFLAGIFDFFIIIYKVTKTLTKNMASFIGGTRFVLIFLVFSFKICACFQSSSLQAIGRLRANIPMACSQRRKARGVVRSRMAAMEVTDTNFKREVLDSSGNLLGFSLFGQKTAVIGRLLGHLMLGGIEVAFIS